jgi:hypothetical protein
MTEGALKIMNHSSKQRSSHYATAPDFCRIFREDMKDLYLLSLVLTADPEKAEQCLVSGLDDCTAGNQVFGEWARAWARRVVIKSAIRMITPGHGNASRVLNPALRTGAKSWTGDRAQLAPAELSAVIELPPLARFAFVMSVLEGYSDQDCALLLGCTREVLIQARVEAFEQIADRKSMPGDTRPKAEPFRGRRGSTEELDIPQRLATPA